MGRIRWTNKKIAELEAEGRGRGKGAAYQPWIQVTDISSRGRTRRVWSPKTGRIHHLLSDVEYHLFLALEWSRDVTDIREQFPLDRGLTQDVARQLGIRHPTYPGTNEPTVMTVDFLVDRTGDGSSRCQGFDTKRTEEAEDEGSVAKLEIQRATLELAGISHHLVFHTDIPSRTVKNIDWIRGGLLKEGEVEPSEGYWRSMVSRMAEWLPWAEGALSLARCCSEFDAMHGVEPGTGLRVAKVLMFERKLRVDLACDSIPDMPVSSFIVSGSSGVLRSVGR